MKFDKEIRAYALRNAIEHGKADAGKVLPKLFNHGLEKKDIGKIMPEIQKIVHEVNKLKAAEKEKEFESLKDLVHERDEGRDTTEMPELTDVSKNGIITRFSPSSSASAFHIGHIFTGMPSSLYVKRYGGKFYLRIEDTNPEKTTAECYKSFPEEADWIFGNVTEWYAQSDRMEKYYSFAEELIKKGFAFVCICEKEEHDEDSEYKKEQHKPRHLCDCRNNKIKDNQEKWKKMLDKKGFGEGEAVLRFKTSSPERITNPALIDFPLARVNLSKHPRQGNSYRVWPLMNLCVTYDDIEQKCTHIIRGKEHQDNAKRQEMIFDALKIKKPRSYFLGRYKFTDFEISKTKISERIKNGEFSGWDDIRLPLVRNFKRRGYQPEAFALMVSQRGLSGVDKVISREDFFRVLDNFNRKLIKDKSIGASFEESKKGKIEILMPDAKIKKGDSDIKIKSLKEGDIVYFRSLGYACFNPREKVNFWFAHE